MIDTRKNRLFFASLSYQKSILQKNLQNCNHDTTVKIVILYNDIPLQLKLTIKKSRELR
jgi:hypothetical protein